MFLGLRFVIASILLLFPWLTHANDFAGANMYFLYALSASDRAAVLDAMASAQMKLLRIFITEVQAGSKGSSARYVPDLETKTVGSYDDTILGLIDTLASEARSRNIKLVIAMHDRYSLGCWGKDAYVAKYGLPVTGCQNGVPDSSKFYQNSGAISDFDNRLRHILNYKSPKFGVPWSQLSDAIFSFQIQNEGMGHMNQVAPNWWCDRANTIRGVLGGSGIKVSTGGGTDLATSLQSQFWNCKNLDIISLHDYNVDPSYVGSRIDAAKPLAGSSGKRMIYEEFGALGNNKQSQLKAVTDVLIATGVPWMIWEMSKPGKGSSDYEIWTDEPSWSTIQSQSKITVTKGGQFGWPEIV